jgi:hypothetical protein
MRLLRGGRRQLPRGHKTMPKKGLLIFPIEQQNLHK